MSQQKRNSIIIDTIETIVDTLMETLVLSQYDLDAILTSSFIPVLGLIDCVPEHVSLDL